MSLTIHSVVNGKTPLEEYVWLLAGEAETLKSYAVVDRTFDDKGKVSNEFRHIFILPNLKIEKGDWIQLYTGKGIYVKSETVHQEKKCFIHKLYWESDMCIWNNNGSDTASLIKYSLVNSVTIPAVKTSG